MLGKLLTLTLLSLTLSFSATAATISPLSSTLTVQIADFGGGTYVGDARGVVFADLLDPLPIGSGVILFGDTGLPFGQNQLSVFNGDFSQNGILSLDFNSFFFSGPNLIVPASYADGVPAPPSDVALQLLSAASKIQFVLNFDSRNIVSIQDSQVTLDTFSLVRVDAVPEPATSAMALGGLALLGAGLVRRRRSYGAR